MYRGIVCCRAGMGSSMLLKIKADQVIKEGGYPIELEHGNLESLVGYNGDLVITMSDLTSEIQAQLPKAYCIGIKNIVSKGEIEEGIKAFLESKK